MGEREGRRRTSSNESMVTEEPSRERVQTECDAVCGRRRGDLRVLEDWEGDSGTEVRLALIVFCSDSIRIMDEGHRANSVEIVSSRARRCGRGSISFLC
jgi:hypothetical protein